MPEPQLQLGRPQDRTRLVVHLVEGGIFCALLISLFGPPISRQLGVWTQSSQARIQARDEQRLHDLALIQSAILQHRLQQGYYPSSSLSTPFIDRSTTDLKIWISSLSSEDLPFDPQIGSKITRLPTDPLNTKDFIYRYKSSIPPADTYELDIKIENDVDGLMKRDGGNNDQFYEVGNDLELI